MERPLRRKDRALSESEAKALLLKGEYGVLSTVSCDGRPYGVPVNYSYTDNCIYFHCALEGHKLDNLQANNNVSFCVVGKTEVLSDKFATKYESVVAFGEAAEVAGDEKQKGLTELLKKYSSPFIKEGLEYIEKARDKTRVYRITIHSITGKARR